VQYDHLGKAILHVDFMRVNLSERVTVEVAIELRGTAEGTHQGGMIETLLGAVEIECKVSEIPDTIPVNIKSLQLNQAIHAGQIDLPAGIKMLTDADAVIVICHEAASAVSAEAAEGEATATQPEVITERRKDETSEK
jgi:large subunit ribosomal protein L25